MRWFRTIFGVGSDQKRLVPYVKKLVPDTDAFCFLENRLVPGKKTFPLTQVSTNLLSRTVGSASSNAIGQKQIMYPMPHVDPGNCCMFLNGFDRGNLELSWAGFTRQDRNMKNKS